MRLALICKDFNARGGVSRDAYMFASALLSLGIEIECYCNTATSTPMDGVGVHHVPTPASRLPERFDLPLAHTAFACRATQAIRRDRGRYDVVLTIGSDAFVHDVVRVHAVVKAENRRWPERGGRHFRAARVRARLAPVVRPLNGVERVIQRRQFDPQRSRRLVAVTEGVRRDLELLCDYPSDRIDVLPCPIDYAAVRAALPADARGQLGLPAGSKTLLFLGNDFYRKGLDLAIRVLPNFDADVHLLVVGSGDATAFRALAERAAVAGRVHFLGHQLQPERFLRDADVLLLPTREDVWGTTLIEAMAAGLPIVTTSAAGASSVVRESESGIVVDDATPHALAGALSPLLEDGTRRQVLGERGAAAAGDFDVRVLAPKLKTSLERAAAAAA